MTEQTLELPDADLLDDLRACAPLSGLPEAALAKLLDRAETRSLAPGEGLEIDGGAAILTAAGRVRVIEGGRFHDAEAGDILFFEDILAGRDAPAAAGTALAPARVIFLSGAAIRDMLAEAGAGAAIARYLAQKLTAGDGSPASPSHRLYSQLVMVAQPNGADGNWRIARMPRHRELAVHAGLSEEAAADAIAHLISTGVARRNYPGLDIIDYDALRRLAAA